MNYYIWKRGDTITAYLETPVTRPAPAIPVTKEEFKELGFYSGIDEVLDDIPEVGEQVELTSGDIVDAIKEGIASV